MKLRVLGRYGAAGASSRVRLLQYLPFLAAEFDEIEFRPLLGDEYIALLYGEGSVGLSYLARRYMRRARDCFRRCELLWLEKEVLPYAPWPVERLLLGASKRLVIDLDDAIFHNYDLHPSRSVRLILGRKIDRLMERADAVTAGNSYLAERAISAGCRRVEVIPTVVDLGRYPLAPEPARTSKPVVGWIGSPGSQRYLAAIRAPLERLQSAGLIRCRLVGATSAAAWNGDVEVVRWTEELEVDEIRKFDVGVMPLPDDPWARGKCAYKLIQYMAAGIPVIASPVGMNRDVVQPGVNGFLASNEQEWEEAMLRLVRDPDLRLRMGKAGRRLVEQQYSLAATAPTVARLFKDLTTDR